MEFLTRVSWGGIDICERWITGEPEWIVNNFGHMLGTASCPRFRVSFTAWSPSRALVSVTLCDSWLSLLRFSANDLGVLGN